MRCPFLREAQVKYCNASAHKKMIARVAIQSENERCSSDEYMNCPLAKDVLKEHLNAAHCPLLHESLVQYCTAAAVTKYIPYSESILSQCGTESHKYCELYLALAQPGIVSTAEQYHTPGIHTIDDIRIPDGLWFSPNHLWLDIGDDNVLHIGVDAFLAKVLGNAERITFVTTKGYVRPAVVLTVQGVDLQFVFPNPVNITRANTYLRTNPEKIFTDPYTVGWLFEANDDQAKHPTAANEGLVCGDDAVKWMESEIQRLSSLAHEVASRPDMQGAVMMADGGTFQQGFAQHLTREELLKLFNDFFSTYAVLKDDVRHLAEKH